MDPTSTNPGANMDLTGKSSSQRDFNNFLTCLFLLVRVPNGGIPESPKCGLEISERGMIQASRYLITA